MAEAVGLAAAIAQLAGLTVELTKLSYTYLNDVRNASKARKMYLREVSALTDVLLRLEMSLQDSVALGPQQSARSNPIPSTTISDCHDVLSLQRSALEKNFNRLLWPFHEKELKKAIEKVHRFRDIFSDYITADTSSKLSFTNHKVDSLKSDQARVQLQDGLEQTEGLSKTQPTPISGTGQWLVNHTDFQEWIKGPPSVLWCRGPPGVGKSLLAAIAIEELSKHPSSKDSCIAHYFCDFTARKQQTESAILRSLLRQVVLHGSVNALSLLSERRNKLTSSPKADDLATAFSDVCRGEKRLYVVVDAIDELEIVKPIVSRLRDFHGAGCSILITSRDSPDISKTLSSFREITLQRSHEQDIHTYIKYRFAGSDFADATAQTSSIAQAVVQNSNGLFLLAKLTMDQLLSFPTIKRMRKALTDLPNQLDDAFNTSVERIDAQPETLRAIAHRLIGWIVSSERPLRTDELTHAFAVDHGDEEVDEENMVMLATLLRACAGLVSVDKDRGTFGMVHTLAYDFFHGRYAGTTEIHKDIAGTSLAYLCLKVLKSGPCTRIDAMDNRLNQLKFLRYAACHWGAHASKPGVESSMRELIREFLNDPGLRHSAFQTLNYQSDITNREVVTAIFDSLPKGQSQLHIAAHWGLELIAKDFLENGADCNAKDYQRWTPLHWATSRGHVRTMRVLVEGGADVNLQDVQGWTPLTWASFNGSLPATALLLEKGARHLETDVHGWTALHWAVSRQEPGIVRLLLKHYAQYIEVGERNLVRTTTVLPTKSDYSDRARTAPAIELAATNADTEVFDLLLNDKNYRDNDFKNWLTARDFDPPMSNTWRTMNKAEKINGMEGYITNDVRYSNSDKTPDQWKATMLHSAIKNDKLEIVQLLISMGTNVNAYTHVRSALHAAACKEDPRFVELLLESHADVSNQDLHGQTALHQAILNGFFETASALVRGGSDVNTRTLGKNVNSRRGSRKDFPVKTMLIDLRRGAVALTPLMLAAGYVLHGDDDRAVQSNMFTLLLSNGADISLEDEAGRTCLHMVARSDAENIALQLLAAGAEVNGRDHRQATPLHYAAQTGHTAMVRTLLEAGAEAVARDAFGVAVIHSAAISCNIEVIRLLIERAVDVHVVDSLGRNSLYYFTAGSTRTDTGLEDLKQIFRWLYPVADLSEINAEHDRDESEFPSWSNNIQVPKTYTPLSKALKDGNWKMFWLLRDAGAEISEPSDEFVRQAVIDIQPTALQYSLEKGITPEMKASFSQRCPDFYISKKIDPDDLDAMLPSLIALGFDINAMGYGNLKLVDAASTTDSAQLARVLLKHGANPYEGHRQLDPFLVAATRQNWDFLHGLLLHAPRPAPEGHWLHHLDNIAGEDHDDPERLCISLQASGFIAAKTNLVFSEAVLSQNERLARLLVSHGLDANKPDGYGWTPLHYAVLHQITPVVASLLEAGANVDNAASFWCDSSWGRPRPSSLSGFSPWTGTALHLASLVANEDIITMLLDHGANIDAHTGTDGRSPLHGPRALHIALGTGRSYGIDAACLGDSRLRIARLLIERGACVKTVADHIKLSDLANFNGYEDVWGAVRLGITADKEEA